MATNHRVRVKAIDADISRVRGGVSSCAAICRVAPSVCAANDFIATATTPKPLPPRALPRSSRCRERLLREAIAEISFMMSRAASTHRQVGHPWGQFGTGQRPGMRGLAGVARIAADLENRGDQPLCIASQKLDVAFDPVVDVAQRGRPLDRLFERSGELLFACPQLGRHDSEVSDNFSQARLDVVGHLTSSPGRVRSSAFGLLSRVGVVFGAACLCAASTASASTRRSARSAAPR